MSEQLDKFALLESSANEGNAEAQCIIANAYHLGLEVQQDLTTAVQWYEKASAQGYAIATNNLAGLILTGYDAVLPNSTEAERLFRLAQEQGFQHTPTSVEYLHS